MRNDSLSNYELAESQKEMAMRNADLDASRDEVMHLCSGLSQMTDEDWQNFFKIYGSASLIPSEGK